MNNRKAFGAIIMKEAENDSVVFSDSVSDDGDSDEIPLTSGIPSLQKHYVAQRPQSRLLVSFAVVSGISVILLFLRGKIDSQGTKQLPLYRLKCHSPTIDRKSVASQGTPEIPPGYKLVQATVHQRHLDRWMYQHDYIDNVCWSHQKNSTDPIMHDQCTYNLSSVWDTAAFDSDPYSDPARGSCNPKQLTIQGKQHAEALGEAYQKMFHMQDGPRLCDPGRIKLESDVAQKNQQSTQHVYKGLCGGFPDTREHPAETVLDDGTIALGRPFFLSLGTVCDSDFYQKAQSEASKSFLESSWIRKMRATARVLAEATDKDVPDESNLAELLDNIEDCVVCHACHGLDDTPHQIWSVLDRVNQQETASRLFVLDAFDYSKRRRDRFAASYFGYYFVVTMKRMERAVEGKADAPWLYLQVTSDGRISALLKMLDAPTELLLTRPLWGSQLIFQVLEKDQSFHVRVLYDGVELRMEPWEAFVAFVESVAPSIEDCADFYDNI